MHAFQSDLFRQSAAAPRHPVICPVKFFIGIHQPSDAWPFNRVMLSVNRLLTKRGKPRKSPIRANEVIVDSAAYSELIAHGKWRTEPERYAEILNGLTVAGGRIVGASTQDFMCEPQILRATGLSVRDHQRLTIERFDRIQPETSVHLFPILQGYDPEEYVEHLKSWEERLPFGAVCGVGSVCKRNGHPDQIAAVLGAIKSERSDLRLHGFGLKIVALRSAEVRALLDSADSMAWSDAARKEGRDGNDPREAMKYASAVGEIVGESQFVV